MEMGMTLNLDVAHNTCFVKALDLVRVV